MKVSGGPEKKLRLPGVKITKHLFFSSSLTIRTSKPNHLQWVENNPANIWNFIAYICKQHAVPLGTSLAPDVDADVVRC
jgi:hypothetical protein